MTIEERLDNVERELGRAKRRNRWLLGAVLLLAGGLVVLAALETTAFRARPQATGTAKEIRARSFVLEDDNSKIRALLGIFKGEERLLLYDENAKPRAYLDRSGLMVADEMSNDLASLTVDKNGGNLYLSGAKGNMGASLAVGKDGPSLNLSDINGRPRVSLSLVKDATVLTLWDEGNETGSLRVGADGSGLELSFNDHQQAWLGVRKDGPGLELFDKKDNLRLVAGKAELTTPDGKTIAYPESSLILFGPDGKVIWSAIR